MTMTSRINRSGQVYGLIIGASLAALVLALAGCTEDPRYMKRGTVLETGLQDGDPALAMDTIVLPIRPETMEEMMKRAELEALAGMPVPLVGLDDLSVSIEWILKNLSDTDGTARIHVNGGNENFIYVPLAFVIDPEEDEEPPPLMGDIPIPVPALGTVSGVFREDQVREASIDLDLITAGGSNPFAAILQQNDDLAPLVGDGGPLVLPVAVRDRAEELIGQMIQFDILLEANRHMVLEYAVRVRDHSGILHELLLDAPAGELVAFAPAAFVPPPPPVPAPMQ